MSDRERALQLDSRLRDVASIIVEKCVDSNTKRPFPHALVERALKDPKIRFIPDNRKSAKQQMLEVSSPRPSPIFRSASSPRRLALEAKLTCPLAQVLPKLQKHKVLEIERARMRVQLTLRTREMKEMVTRRLGEEPLSDTCQVEREKEEGAPASTSCNADNQGKSGGSAQYTYSCVMKIEPGAFRTIDSLVRGKQANAGRLEVLDLAVHNDSVVAEAEGRAGKPTKITEQMGSLGVSGDLPRGGERAVGRFKCNTCLVGFEESKLHREHFKSDWHRVNLKLRHAGEACVTEEEFMMMESAAMDSDLDHYM